MFSYYSLLNFLCSLHKEVFLYFTLITFIIALNIIIWYIKLAGSVCMQNTYLDLLAKYGISSAHPGGMALTKKLLDNVKVNKESVILDIGCGTGETLSYIESTYHCKPMGVDINPKMLQKASQRFKANNQNIELIRADITALPLQSAYFDFALSESVSIFSDIRKALSEYSRVIKNNGTLILIEMTAAHPLSERESTDTKSVYGIQYVPTYEEWAYELLNSGFVIEQSYAVEMIKTYRLKSAKMIHDFYPHLKLLNRYKNILKYRVYICRKEAK